MVLNGLDYMKSRFGLLNFAEILCQVAMITLLISMDISTWMFDDKHAPVPDKAALIMYYSTMSVTPLCFIYLLAVVVYYILRTEKWMAITAMSGIMSLIWSQLHLFTFIMTANMANWMGDHPDAPKDKVGPFAALTLFHLGSSALFALDFWTTAKYTHMLKAEDD